MSINIKTKNELLFNKTESLDILYTASLFTGFLGIIMMLLGFISWYELTQKYQDKIAREKVKAITRYIFCQSCGVRLTNDEYYITLPEPKKRQTKYCSYCYRDGKFIEPDLTFEEMKLKIEKRCEELKFNKFQTKVVIKHAKKLDRWAKRYKW